MLFFDEGATISRPPLLNILVSGKNPPVSVLDLVGCQGCLTDGEKKDVTFICNIFPKDIKKPTQIGKKYMW